VTTAAPVTTAPPETTEAPDIGAAEKADLTIGIRIPNVGSNAPLFVGIDQGFYADEGLTVEIIETESVREGLVGGSLDFALAESMDVVDAASIGVPISIVAGYRNRQPFYVATHSSIGSPEDLAGKDILLGGTPGSLDYDLRAGVMAENGYDISGIDVNPVSVPGGSNAWVELLLEGELDMTVFFARHKPSIVDAGHNVVLDVFKEWPNDSIAAADDFVASNPNTTARFIRATLRAMEFWMDPSNQDAVQAMAPNYGFNPKDAEKDPAVYGEDLALYDVDMGLDPAAFDEALGKLVDLGAFDSAPAMGTYTNLDALHAAQDALGIAQRPTAAEVAASTGVAAAPDLGAAEKADLTIGIRIPNVGSNAPLFVGIDQGFYADEGLTVEIIETESVREGLVGGSLDFALAESMDVVDAASIGVPISIVAGYRNRQPFYVATHSSIGSPEDLAGKDILLGGTPGSLDYDLRAGVMAENGYDISGIDVNPVSVPGGSNAWVELLLEGELDMTVFFARHKPSIVDAGHNVVLDVFKEWPNDSIAAADDFVASNPNTTARFIRATLRAMEFWMDPSNQDAVQAMAPNYGFNPKDAEKDPAVYGEDLALYDVDMGLDPAAFDEALGKLVDLGAFDSAPAFDTYTNLDALHAAQDALGIARR
jgi:NitT/TauT family transport system substrate-binding protein